MSLRRDRLIGGAAKGFAEDIVRGALGKSPSAFGGTYRLLCGGKLGEVFFAGGAVKALRQQLPRARLVLDCWPNYAFVAKALRDRFDAVEAGHSRFYFKGGIYKGRNEVAMSLFRGSPIFPGKLALRAPFYQVFARSAGARFFSTPSLKRGVTQDPLVLALPTMNRNASARGRLPFDAAGWEELGDAIRAAGLTAVATGAPGDGVPRMPGWTWAGCGREGVLRLVQRSQVVLGGNSGLVFMAAALGKQVVMLNDIDNALTCWWDPQGMTDVPGLHAIRYLRLRPNGLDDERALAFTREALGDFLQGQTPGAAPATDVRRSSS